MQMQKEKRVFVIEAMVSGGKTKYRTKIVVDSVAASCVMPKELFPELETLEALPGTMFVCANGSDLGNFGRHLIEFAPLVVCR